MDIRNSVAILNFSKTQLSVFFAESKLDPSNNTPWKFNIDPENKPSQKEIHLSTVIFQGLG